MADETALALGRIEGSLAGINAAIGDVKAEQSNQREATQALERETTAAFGEMRTNVALLGERLESHEEEDGRLHVRQQADIDRAHLKATEARTAMSDCQARHTVFPDGSTGRPTKAQMGTAGGILTGLAAAGAWLWSNLRGTPPP